jgi:hypothetical protein
VNCILFIGEKELEFCSQCGEVREFIRHLWTGLSGYLPLTSTLSHLSAAFSTRLDISVRAAKVDPESERVREGWTHAGLSALSLDEDIARWRLHSARFNQNGACMPSQIRVILSMEMRLMV